MLGVGVATGVDVDVVVGVGVLGFVFSGPDVLLFETSFPFPLQLKRKQTTTKHASDGILFRNIFQLLIIYLRVTVIESEKTASGGRALSWPG